MIFTHFHYLEISVSPASGTQNLLADDLHSGKWEHEFIKMEWKFIEKNNKRVNFVTVFDELILKRFLITMIIFIWNKWILDKWYWYSNNPSYQPCQSFPWCEMSANVKTGRGCIDSSGNVRKGRLARRLSWWNMGKLVFPGEWLIYVKSLQLSMWSSSCFSPWLSVKSINQ